MDLALPTAVCIYCSTQAMSLLVCAQCEMVGYCSDGCRRKHVRKHKGRCRQIANMRNQTEEISEDMARLKIGYEALDLDLDYGSSSQFYTWVEDVHHIAIYQIVYHLEEICKKGLHWLTVKQLLWWKILTIMQLVVKVGLNPCSYSCLNYFCALGRFQEALDWAGHWIRKEPLVTK